MSDPDPPLRARLSPAAFAPFEGVPGCCALARDTELRVVWCNDEYARRQQRTPESVIGLTLHDVMPKPLADERAGLMRRALTDGVMVAYQQLWLGHRWLTRVWPLDPDAFRHEGYFVVITKLNEPIPETAHGPTSVEFVRSAHLGDLAVLSPRELEVFYYLAAGMTVGDIATSLHRSEKTIGRHVENLHRKMSYSNRAQLVRDAVERGLVAFSGPQWRTLVDLRPAT